MTTNKEILHKLKWRPTHNGITVDASMDVVIRPAKTNRIVLFVPGVDGSADGYKNKYVNASDLLTDNHEVGIVRISNDFISSFHWEDNVRQVLDYISDNFGEYFNNKNAELSIVAHSAGASIVASVSREYPVIKQLLLINMPSQLQPDKVLDGLKQFEGRVGIVYGEHDPSIMFTDELRRTGKEMTIRIIEGANHTFSGSHLAVFERLPLDLFKADDLNEV